jgi:GAF domain-containing protein/HAMP domain-containing protein
MIKSPGNNGEPMRSTSIISNKQSNSTSLRTRLVLFVLFVSLVPLTIIAVRDTLQTQQALTNGANTSLKSGAAQTANSMDTFIQATLDSVAGEAQFGDFTTFLTLSPAAPPIVQARAQDLLNKLRDKANPNIISYGLVDVKGKVLLDTQGINVNNDESGEAYFSQVRITNKSIVTAVTYSNEKTPSITFASKVADINGDYLGVLRVKYNSAVLQDVITNSVGSSTDASVLLLDPLHIRMADSQNPDLVLKSIVPLEVIDYLLAVNTRRLLAIPAEEQATNYPDFELALDNAKDQPFFRADITPKIAGDDTIAVAFLKTQPWTIAYSRPTSILLADVQRQTRANIIFVFGALVIISIITALIARSLTNPITALAKVADSISHGDLNARAKVNSTDEIGVLAAAFNSMTERLSENLVNLEERIAMRTNELESANEINTRRARQFEAISRVTRAINQTQNLQDLLPQITQVINQQFNFYHVGIFLMNANNEYAVFAASNSAGGQKMLARNHKLKVGQMGIVGNVAMTGIPRIALDTGSDAAYFNNPDLPETRSEMALPLFRGGQQLIGIIDVQSTEPNAFGQEDIQTLSTLAEQVSIAIVNARLYEETQKALLESEMFYRRDIQTGWTKFVRSQKLAGIRRLGMKSNIYSESIALPGESEVIRSGTPYIKNDVNSSQMTIPVKLRGERVGMLSIKTDEERKLTSDEMDIITAIVERAALSMESTRLLAESRTTAEKERVIGEISAKISAGTEIETILKTAVRELGNQIGGAHISVEIGSENE